MASKREIEQERKRLVRLSQKLHDLSLKIEELAREISCGAPHETPYLPFLQAGPRPRPRRRKR